MNLLRRLLRLVGGDHPDWGDPARLLDSAPDAMLVVDREGRIVLLNSQAQVLFGYPREELLGQPVETLVPARFSQLHAKHRAAYAAEPHLRPMGSGLDLSGKKKNGVEFPVEISLSPLRTAQGWFVIAAVRDISDRKHAEEQIKKLNAELAEALRRSEKLAGSGKLASEIAREIDHALDPLKRSLALLAQDPALTPALKDLVAQSQEQVGRISEITTRTLGLQRAHDAWKKS